PGADRTLEGYGGQTNVNGSAFESITWVCDLRNPAEQDAIHDGNRGPRGARQAFCESHELGVARTNGQAYPAVGSELRGPNDLQTESGGSRGSVGASHEAATRIRSYRTDAEGLS